MSTARTSRWIIDARTDITWFVLPALTGYLCLFVNVMLGVSSFVIWWFWNVAANGPHFYATISRTYLDREEWQEHRTLLVLSLLWLLTGPLAIWLSIRAHSMGPFIAFWVFQVVWAYYHVARQHYGFMAIYQKLNGEPAGSANRADFWIFHTLMFGPVLAWFLRYPDFRNLLGWSIRPSPAERVVLGLTIPLIVVAILGYVFKEALRYHRTRRINVPKSMLLIACVPLHLLLLLNPTITGTYDILLFNAVITFPHNLQYVAIVWFHNRNRYNQPSSTPDYGMAAAANRSVAHFALLAIAFSVVVLYARFYFEGQAVPFGFGRYPGADASLGGMFRFSDLIAATWIGVVFHHQYLDQKIWKISRDRGLTRDLRLDEERAPVQVLAGEEREALAVGM